MYCPCPGHCLFCCCRTRSRSSVPHGIPDDSRIHAAAITNSSTRTLTPNTKHASTTCCNRAVIQQVNNLREIQALRRLSPNQHVITLEEVLYDQPTGRLALVFELMDANLYELIRGRRHYLSGQVQCHRVYSCWGIICITQLHVSAKVNARSI